MLRICVSWMRMSSRTDQYFRGTSRCNTSNIDAQVGFRRLIYMNKNTSILAYSVLVLLAVTSSPKATLVPHWHFSTLYSASITVAVFGLGQ